MMMQQHHITFHFDQSQQQRTLADCARSIQSLARTFIYLITFAAADAEAKGQKLLIFAFAFVVVI